MERRVSRDDDASDSSSSSGSSSDEGEYDDNDQNARADEDSSHGHVATGRRYHKKRLVETPSSNRANHVTSMNDRGGGSNSKLLAKSRGAIVPNRKDVLLGRGRPYQNFGGNKRMLRIVSRFKEEYASRPRDQKRLFVETVLDAVLKDGTRFLRRVDESEDGSDHHWEEVDRSTAADKVWHALRSKDRSMQSKVKLKGSLQLHHEGDDDDESAVSSHSSRMKNEDRHTHHRHNLAVSRDTTSSSDGIGGLIDKNMASRPQHQRSQEEERDRTTSASIPPSIESLTREIAYHLNKAVEATNLLSAMIGAPLNLPGSSLPLTMLAAGAPRNGDNRNTTGLIPAPQQHNHSLVEEVVAMNNAMFPPGGSSHGASAPSPVNSQVQSTTPLLPFSSMAGLLPSSSVAQYLSTLSNVGVGAGGLVGSSVPTAFPDARQIAQMTALYPRLFSGGNAPPGANTASSSSQLPTATAPTTTTVDRSQQILLQALATLSRQAAQHGSGQSPAPPR